MTERILPFFVYGYLKRGGPGHHLVEGSIEDVRPAVARGHRVDTGADYPGVTFTSDGDEVEGELLYIRNDDFADVARTLDAYEQTEAPDRYTRATTFVKVDDEEVECYVYQWTGP